MGRLTRFKPSIARFDQRTAKPAPKKADPFYQSAEWESARRVALARAEYRCEEVEDGQRCHRGRSTGDRIIVDHVQERRDGGADLDQANLRCLCFEHHGLKTAAARAARMASRP